MGGPRTFRRDDELREGISTARCRGRRRVEQASDEREGEQEDRGIEHERRLNEQLGRDAKDDSGSGWGGPPALEPRQGSLRAAIGWPRYDFRQRWERSEPRV